MTSLLRSLAIATGLLAATTACCRGAPLHMPSTSTAPSSFQTAHPRSDGVRTRLSSVERAQFSFQPFELTDVCFECSRPNASALFSCNIQFDWFDPNSVKENNTSSCSCSYSWDWDGQTVANGANNTYDAVDFLVCSNHYPSMFEMRVNSFSGPANLTLFMSHYYKDSSLWGPPYLYAQTWAMPILNLTRESRHNKSMSYYMVGPILANITGLEG